MNQSAAASVLHGAGALKLTVLFGIGQAIPLLVAPVLTRLYGPESFGQLSVFVAFVVIGASAATLKIEQVVLVARVRKHALHAAWLALACAVLVTVVAELGLAAGGRVSLERAFGEGSRSWSSLIGIGMLAAAAALVASNWLLRNARFGAVGLVRVTQTGLYGVLGIAFGIAGLPQGLVVAQLSGTVLAAVIGGGQLRHDLAAAGWPGAARVRAMVRRYGSFPLIGAPASILDTFGLYLPVLLFAQFFGQSENGYFALARLCLLAVTGVLSASTGQAFVLAATRSVHGGTPLVPLLRRQLARQGVIAAAFFVATVAFAPALFGWFFGEAWSSAGIYAAWLAAPLSAALLVSPLSGLLAAAERMGLNAVWQFGHVLCIAALALPAYASPIRFVQAFCVVDILCYGIYLALIVSSAEKHDRMSKA